MPTYLGEFEQLVLLAILRLDDRSTGAAIRHVIGEASGRVIWIGAVHTTLDRLESKGVIRSHMLAGVEGRRPHKTFALQPAGRAALARAHATWARMTRGLKPKLESL